MKKPNYYLAVFGKPELPDKDTVDSGRLCLGKRGADTPGERGDIMLLFCTASDTAYFMTSPGIGILLTKTREYIFYRYLPFSSPLSKDQLDARFTDVDRAILMNMKSNTYWLFEMSNESFFNCTRGESIKWP